MTLTGSLSMLTEWQMLSRDLKCQFFAGTISLLNLKVITKNQLGVVPICGHVFLGLFLLLIFCCLLVVGSITCLIMCLGCISSKK